jgi:hypothetical protein
LSDTVVQVKKGTSVLINIEVATVFKHILKQLFSPIEAKKFDARRIKVIFQLLEEIVDPFI